MEKTQSILNRVFLPEFLGTFSLVLFGCGSIMLVPENGGAIALSFGGIICVMIILFGDYSAAHFNPAVSFGFFAAGRISLSQLWVYLLAELVGALLASLALLIISEASPAYQSLELAATVPRIPIALALLVELMISFLLMTVILNVASDPGKGGLTAAVAIGGYVALAAFVIGPLTGASMNPARSIAPGIFFSESRRQLWLYILSPICGTVLAGLTILRKKPVQPDPG